MSRRLVAMLLCVLCTTAAMGGDIAMFENLGFDRDGRTFAFGQYGLAAEGANPYAEIYVVDVAGNRFVSNGVFSMTSTQPTNLGQDGRGAFYSLLGDAGSVLRSRGVDHVSTGRPVYILVDGDEPKERLTFRDFNTSTRYDVRLTQASRGTGEDIEASFYIDLTLTMSDDSTRTFTVGRPGYYRDGVADYRITQIVVGPDDESIVFVVQKRMHDGSVRFMVETLAI